MVGLPPSRNPKLDGCNILPLMEGKESVARFADGRQRESIYFYYPQCPRSSSAMRKGHWKIYRNLAPGTNRSPLVGLYRLYNNDGSVASIRGLRHAILDLKGGVPQADNYYLNLFRQGSAF